MHQARRVVAGPLGRDTNRYASNDSLRIACELQGLMHRRRPWLVLIQGRGFDRSGWDPVLSVLRRRFRLVLVDNRGTGRSDRPDGSFAVADMAGDVVAVLDAAGDRHSEAWTGSWTGSPGNPSAASAISAITRASCAASGRVA